MADIFINYSRSDRDRVQPLVKLLEAGGWSVWWDRDLIHIDLGGGCHPDVRDDEPRDNGLRARQIVCRQLCF